MNRNKAFTVLELVVVVIMIATIASLALPKYSKTIDRAHCDNAVMQLRAIHATNEIYNAQEGNYWPDDAITYDVNDLPEGINASLGLNIIEDGVNYDCNSPAGNGTNYTCRATRGTVFTLQVIQNPLQNANPYNPGLQGNLAVAPCSQI